MYAIQGKLYTQMHGLAVSRVQSNRCIRIVATPADGFAIYLKAAAGRSMPRQPANGPPSLMRATTDRPALGLVILTLDPNRRVCAPRQSARVVALADRGSTTAMRRIHDVLVPRGEADLRPSHDVHYDAGWNALHQEGRRGVPGIVQTCVLQSRCFQ